MLGEARLELARAELEVRSPNFPDRIAAFLRLLSPLLPADHPAQALRHRPIHRRWPTRAERERFLLTRPQIFDSNRRPGVALADSPPLPDLWYWDINGLEAFRDEPRKLLPVLDYCRHLVR